MDSEKKKCPIFGNGKKLPKNYLPTCENILSYNVFLQSKPKNKLYIIVDEIQKLWRKANISIICRQRIILLVKQYIKKYKSVLKCAHKTSFPVLVDIFKKKTRVLFDICSCKCEVTKSCKCPLPRKVPPEKHAFLLNQRSSRNMTIPKYNNNKNNLSGKCNSFDNNSQNTTTDDDDIKVDNDDEKDIDYTPETKITNNSSLTEKKQIIL